MDDKVAKIHQHPARLGVAFNAVRQGFGFVFGINGNVISQLFANIYLNELDQFVKRGLKVKYYIRYCDDFVVLGENLDYLAEISGRISNFLIQRLKLYLHPDKVITRKYHQGIDFLGYVVLPHCKVLRISTKRRMLRKVSKENLVSYLGVLKHCSGYNLKIKVLKRVCL